MSTAVVDTLVTHLHLAPEEPCAALVVLAKRECPNGGSLEIEQHIEGVGTTRVKVTKG